MNDGQQEETHVPRRHPVPSRHAKIMRGIVTPIFGLLAVTCIVFGILNQTIWKPSRDVTAVAHVDGTQYAVIDPGVLDLVDKSVQIRVDAASVEPAAGETTSSNDTNDTNTNDDATADAAKEPATCIAIGSPKDASGWLAGESYTRVTGLSSWSALSTTNEQARGNASTSDQQVAFADSDMWANTSCGKTSAALRLPDAQATQVAIVDFGGKASDATISMHWVRQSVPNFALPWYFAGGLCIILAVLSASVFAMDPDTRRNRFAKVIKPRKKKEQVEETTTIAAAVAGTFASMKPRRRPKGADGKPRGRHGRHAGAAAQETEPPQIIDPTSRNLVAEQARHTAADGQSEDAQPRSTTSANASDEATSVITPEELQAYFARLVREETGSIPPVTAEAAPETAATTTSTDETTTEATTDGATTAVTETTTTQSDDAEQASVTVETAVTDDDATAADDIDEAADTEGAADDASEAAEQTTADADAVADAAADTDAAAATDDADADMGGTSARTDEPDTAEDDEAAATDEDAKNKEND